MNTPVARLILTLLPLLPLPAGAVLLDCEINAERIYRCVEINASAVAPDTAKGQDADAAEYARYVAAAKKACVYTEPPSRPAAKNASAALRAEKLKAAREAYEQCVADKTRALWLKNRSAD